MLHRNLPLKIAAIGLAIFLWFWVTISKPGSPRRTVEGQGSRPAAPTLATRTVPVVLQSEGRLPPNLKVVSVQLDPPVVTIVGPRARVESVDVVRTAELNLSRATRSFARRLRLIVPPGVTAPNATAARVTLELAPAPPEQLLQPPPTQPEEFRPRK